MSTANVIHWVERGMVPDTVVRAGIRQLLRQRLTEIDADDPARVGDNKQAFVDAMRLAPVAPVPDAANGQHYEVPAAFFDQVLGARRKYSAGLWPAGVEDLDASEDAALAQACARAGIADGMSVLDLGCGWGSLSLWIAEHYPRATVDAVSNSASQGEYIRAQAKQRGLDNVTVRTADMNDFFAGRRYDRVVSVEMFEHMRNYPELFARIADWLEPGGRFFLHIFAHRSAAYAFVDEGPGDWMSRHFFTGGIMPSDDLPLYFQDHLALTRRWRVDGRHYERTANAWLAKMDENRDRVMPILASVYGDSEAGTWMMRWRVFFMACAELFGYRQGREWGVSHYLFRKAGH